jgi:hypothetical protein
LRLVCDLDRKADDGNSDDGDIRTSDNSGQFGSTTGDYTSSDDCWELTGNAIVELKVLP